MKDKEIKEGMIMAYGTEFIVVKDPKADAEEDPEGWDNWEHIGYHKDFCIPKDEIRKEIESKSTKWDNLINIHFAFPIRIIKESDWQKIKEKLLGATSQGSPEHQRGNKK